VGRKVDEHLGRNDQEGGEKKRFQLLCDLGGGGFSSKIKRGRKKIWARRRSKIQKGAP